MTEDGPRLVVDAMNVIGARPDGWWRDRDAALRRLVRRLGDYAHQHDVEPLVVADGFALADLPPGRHGRVELRYAQRSGPDAADDVIVELLDGCLDEVTVVTADRGLRERVRLRGAEVVGPTWLWRELDGLDGSAPRSDD